MSERNPDSEPRPVRHATFPKEAGGLTAQEVQRGWVEHHCDVHGFLVATTPRATVNCECGRVARIIRGGRLVQEDTLKATRATPRRLNRAGYAYRCACDMCGEDFGGTDTRRRHYIGRGPDKTCRPEAELVARGLRLNDRGCWVREAPDPARFRGALSGLDGPKTSTPA